MSNNIEANPDLKVDLISDSLAGVTVELVISGSIGATESVKFIRSLRRLGATVRPYLTKGAKLFTTSEAIEWASASKPVETFTGSAPHISTGDLLVIAPASASIINKIASGIADSPATTLVQSYLGSGKPIYLLPNMHFSLQNSPFTNQSLERIKPQITVLSPRNEENKLKFPSPNMLADHISHNFNSLHVTSDTMICMGSTKGYIDDVRYITNYSSGALGTKISEDCYRYGIRTHLVCGASNIKPSTYTRLELVDTNSEMLSKALDYMNSFNGKAHVVMLASVLDYNPAKTTPGKIRSGAERLSLELIPTQKIISKLLPEEGHLKIGFKLEPELNERICKKIALEYTEKYSLTHIFVNALGGISDNLHKATAYFAQREEIKLLGELTTKTEIATLIRNEIIEANRSKK